MTPQRNEDVTTAHSKAVGVNNSLEAIEIMNNVGRLPDDEILASFEVKILSTNESMKESLYFFEE